ncbi:CRISPR-associated endonuclease Cas1 [Phycisphaerales bacterium]|nr:CRISPR-associated endonuclease Cas1 [Phycisphaerales bacterium]
MSPPSGSDLALLKMAIWRCRTIGYATTPGSVVRRRNTALVITVNDETTAVFPLADLDRLVTVGRVQLTADAARLLLEHRIPTTLLTRGGRIVGTLAPPSMPAGRIRQGQVVVAMNEHRRMAASRRLVIAKIDAMRGRLESWSHNHDDLVVRTLASKVGSFTTRAETCLDRSSLMGVEGAAARLYWAAFADTIEHRMGFAGRRARPATDPVNSMLSFGYALLRTEVQAAIDGVGLDPWTGIHHVAHGQRPSMVLDLMEPWRHRIVDKLVSSLVNRRQFVRHHFEPAVDASKTEDADRAGDGIRFETEAMRRFIAAFETAMEQTADGGDRPARLELHEYVREIAQAFSRQAMTLRDSEEKSHDDAATIQADDAIEPPSAA